MRIAITGGSGVVGAALCRHLVEAGHQVRGLSRSEGSDAVFVSLGVEPVRGDILDRDSLTALVDDCGWVFHVAGINEMCAVRLDQMWRANVGGTRSVVEACRDAGVGRLIHTSSAVTIGEEKGTVGSETSTHRGWYLSEYERSKTEAERVLFAEAGELDVVSVNPSSVQGPGRATGTGELVLRAARGRLPFVIDTSISLVDIDDCARGHVLAAEKGVRGERYILSGSTLAMEDAIELLRSATGNDVSPRYIGVGALRPFANLFGFAYKVAGKTPPICREALRVMAHGHRYDGTKATHDLGLDYTPIEDTLHRTIDWFRSERLLD